MRQQSATSPDILAALRDFFHAADAGSLKAGYESLAAHLPLPPAGFFRWELEEFAFNRLFIGPQEPLAPFFASAYLDPEQRLMGDTTMGVRAVYEAAGLTLPEGASLPDDALPYELDACRVLSALAASGVAEAHDLLTYFKEEHIARWVPRMIERAHASGHISPALIQVLQTTANWIID